MPSHGGGHSFSGLRHLELPIVARQLDEIRHGVIIKARIEVELVKLSIHS